MGFPFPYPLGLPKGSVRATTTILLTVDLLYLTLQGSQYADSIATMTIVALTFYFGGNLRTSSPMPRSTGTALRAWGLPAGTIRVILVLLFAASTGYLLFLENDLPPYLLEILNIIGGFLLGKIYLKMKGERENKKLTIFHHLKALTILALTSASLYFTQYPIPELDLLLLGNSLLLGFYFGARD